MAEAAQQEAIPMGREVRRVGPYVVAGLCLLGLGAFRADVIPAADRGELRAFPGAEGFGAYTRGGRGGEVYVVSTLEDYGEDEEPIPGSLRQAVEAEGPRIVVFRVAGTIDLKRGLAIREPYITIAGQTAPGGGICLRRWPLTIRTHDVVVRYLRCRPGNLSKAAVDGLGVVGSTNVVLDHLSVSWGIDETLSVTAESDLITVQWCMITEALHNSYHPKGNHGYGSLINGGRMSWHHNLYADHRSRNPRPGDVYLDFRNNVVYNWGDRSGYNGDEETRMTYVGNYLRPGPSTKASALDFAFWAGGRSSRIHVSGNVIEGFPEKEADNRLIIHPPDDAGAQEALGEIILPEPLLIEDRFAVETDPAATAFRRVLDGAGATLPKRDTIDLRIVQEVRENAGQLIDSQDEVGGWPELESRTPPSDTDMDGMPDEWESARGLDPDDPADGSADRDGDGYTNIEEYINGLVPAK